MRAAEESARGTRAAILWGPEPWRTFDSVEFSHWDLWFLVLLVQDYASRWDDLTGALRARRDAHQHARDDAEAKLSHLADLRRRLERLGVSPVAITAGTPLDPRLARKARRKVLELGVEELHQTPAMRDTPRKRLRARALRGHWDALPVSPLPFARRLGWASRRGFYGERATLALSRRLSARLAAIDRRLSDARRLALYRAALTVVVEVMDRADDSCGSLGELFWSALERYRAIPWAATGIAPETYYRDLLEFAVWEDYGLTSRRLDPFFAAVAPDHVALVEAILREVRAELLSLELDYQAEAALTLLGELHVAERSFDRFVDLGAEMGSRAWERITRMAEAALRARRTHLAAAIFAAADQPGFHREYLRRRRSELLGAVVGVPPLAVIPGEGRPS